MKNSVLLTVILLLAVGSSSFASDTRILYGCHGQTITFSSFEDTTSHIELFIGDSTIPPIIIATGYSFPANAEDSVYYFHIIPKDTTKEDAWLVLLIYPRPNAYFSHTVNGFEATFNPVTNVKVPPRWTFGDHTSSGAVGSFTHTYAAPGEYIVEHVLTDTIGCVGYFKETLIVPSGIDSNTLTTCDKMQVTMGANGIITAYRSGDTTIIAQGKQMNFKAKLSDISYFFHVVPDDTTIPEKWYMMRVYPLPDASFSYTINASSVTFNPKFKSKPPTMWDMGDGSYYTENDTFTHTYAAPGTYVIMHTVTDTVGCTSTFTDTIHVRVNDITNIDTHLSDINLYPNPATAYTELRFTLRKEAFIIVDLLDVNGRQLSNLSSNSHYASGQHIIELNTRDLESGLYFLRLRINESLVYKKLMKN